jgi:NTE family protein
VKVGLALGGGGARGFAHIGVFRALRERHLDIVAVAGCSMGGIIGAFIAHGRSAEETREVFREMNPIRLIDRARKGAIFGGKGLAHQLESHLPERFEDLKTPLRVTAVDVQGGRVVTIGEGALIPALRATSALPGIFSPVEIDSRILIDGGLLSNVPVDQVHVIAVDVTVPANRKLVFEDNRTFWEKLKEPIQAGKRPLFIDLLVKAYDIPAAVLSDLLIAVYRPEILIRPPLDPDLKVEDFGRMEEAVESGYEEAARVLDSHELTRGLADRA